MVKDIHPRGGSSPAELTGADGTLFFAALDGVHDYELWRTISQPSGRDPSRTTLKVRKRLHRLVARGGVRPWHPNRRVIVTLQKRKNGTFVTIARKRPTLGARSRYRVRLERPAAGRCGIIARFRGDEYHTSSSARSKFRC
jgi:hypothetical protein